MNDQTTTTVGPILQDNTNLPLFLVELQNAIKSFPVGHYVPPSADNPSGFFEFDIRKNPPALFEEDYSDAIAKSKHAGMELVELFTLFARRMLHESSTQNDLGGIFSYPVPSDKNQLRSYTDGIEHILRSMEAIADGVAHLLKNQPLNDKKPFSIFNDYMYKPFRDTAPDDELNYMFPRDEKMQNFFQSMKTFRNKIMHEDNGHPEFLPPTAVSEKDDDAEHFQEKLSYWRRLHYGVALFVLILFDRFYDELQPILSASEQEEETDNDHLLADSKKIIKNFYIQRVHSTADRELRRLFHGTGIHLLEHLAEDLPELQIKYRTKADIEIHGEGAALFTENESQTRKLLIGAAGTGKTVMFLRMLIHNQPMLTPFYLHIQPQQPFFTSPDDTIRRLEQLVLGTDRLLLNKGWLDATLKRLHHLIKTGDAVFFIDALEKDIHQLPAILEFIKQYPLCQFFIAAQPEALEGEEVTESLKQTGFQFYYTQDFSDEQIHQAMRLVSTHLHNTDHTNILSKKIYQLTRDAQMLHNPLSLMQLLGLLEKGETRTLKIHNPTTLHAAFYQRIQTLDLEPDERELLRERPFLRTFEENQRVVDNLYRQVISEFMSQPKGDWQTPILQCRFVQEGTPHSLKQLFEHMELIESNLTGIRSETEAANILSAQTANIFRTLVTQLLLSQGEGREGNSVIGLKLDNTGLAVMQETAPPINPMLPILAEATSALIFATPKPQDVKAIESQPRSRLIFRPQPRYIIQQQLLTLMNLYKNSPVSIPQLCELFKAIALLGSERLMQQLFTPDWMRLWLIHPDDNIPGTDEHGQATSGNPLIMTLVQYCAAPVVFILQMLKQKAWIDTWQCKSTSRTWGNTVYRIILYEMTDEQRERLCLQMQELHSSVDPMVLGFHRNMAIAAMENLTLVHLFDPSMPPQGKLLQHKLMEQKNKPEAMHLLALWLMPLLKTRNMAWKDIAIHLAQYQVTEQPETNQLFWDFILYLLDENRHMHSVAEILDHLSIDTIRQDIAERVYDMRLFNYLKKCNYRFKKWRTPPSPYLRPEMYQVPVPQHRDWRRAVRFTFYCQQDSSTFLLAAEGMDEMPENKFCRLKSADGDAGQWFHVIDVMDLQEEHPIEDFAELTICLPPNAPRPQRGSIGISSLSDDNNAINYIHLFERANSPVVVIRIEDQRWVRLLKDPVIQQHLKSNQQIIWGNNTAILTAIDVRPLNPHMRLLQIRSVTSDMRYAYKPQPIKHIPHIGTVSFYHKKDLQQTPTGLPLKTPFWEFRSDAGQLTDSIYLGTTADGLHYIATHKNVYPGIYLHSSEWPGYAEVAATFLTTPDSPDRHLLPNSIYERFGKSVKMLRQKTAKSGDKRPVFYGQVVAFRFIGEQQKTELPLRSNGFVFHEPISVYFYHPVCDPEPAAWEEKHKGFTTDAVMVKKLILDEERVHVLALPAHLAALNPRFYKAENYTQRRPIVWYTPVLAESADKQYSFIRVDSDVRTLWENPQLIQLFSAADDQPLPLHFPTMAEVIEVNRTTRYHVSLVPLLIAEARAEDRPLSKELQQFCDFKLRKRDKKQSNNQDCK